MNRPRLLVMTVAILILSLVFIMSNQMQLSPEVTRNSINQIDGDFLPESDIKQQLVSLGIEIKQFKSNNRLTKQLQQDMAQIKSDLDSVKAQLKSQQELQDLARHSVDINQQVPDSASLVDSISNSEQQNKATISSIQNSFDDEVIDINWSTEMTSVLNTAFTDLDTIGGTLSNIECRATMCRVDIIYDNQESVDKMFYNIPLQVSKQLPTINYEYENFTDEKIGVTMFMAKK